MRVSGGGRRLDVRTVVRRLGGLLIITGALVLGFVAFQLWGTGIEHANAQRDLRTEFQQSLADGRVESEPEVTPRPTVDTPPPATVPTATSIGRKAVSPGLVATSRTRPTRAVTTTKSTSPTTTVPPTTAPPPTLPPQPVFAPGDPVARLEIPRIGVDEIVVSGVGVEDLKKGPGHYPQTPLPGQPGNTAIAGHRTTYGAPFFSIDEVAPGDEIIATTFAGRFVYRVTGTVVVSPTDVGVIAGTADARLTLTSCHPLYSAADRIVVTAQLDAEHSAPIATVPPPAREKTAASTTAPARPRTARTTVAPKRVATTTTTAAPPRRASTTTTTATTATTTTTTSTTTGSTVPADSGPGRMIPLADAFGGGASGSGGSSARPSGPAGAGGLSSTQVVPSLGTGWFDDTGALVDILLWGAVCVGVVLVTRLATRRVGHQVLCSVLAAAPFAVALFFFYENLNRVLPAGV
jgi:sortase A